MVFPGNYFFLEMLVFTVESKAGFFITPGTGGGLGPDGGSVSSPLCGHRIPVLWRGALVGDSVSTLF